MGFVVFNALFAVVVAAVPSSELSAKIEAALPASLTLTDLVVRGTMPADAKDVSVEWRSAPRPGTMTVRAGWRDVSGKAAHAWVSLRLAEKKSAPVVGAGVPPVARGTELSIIARAGAATVKTAGLLERSARIGERTAARMKNSGRMVWGVLIDARTLEIREGDRP